MVNLNYFFAGSLLLLASCNPPNPLKIDVSDEPVKIKMERFDQELFAVKPEDLSGKIPAWKKEYGDFFKFYTNKVLAFRTSSDTILAQDFKDFVKHPDILELHAACEKEYSSLDRTEAALNEGFKHYHHYFPERLVPRVVSFISVFTYSIACGDSILGIALDMYLGDQFKYYTQVGIPNFKIRKMRREYISCEAFKGWADTEFEPQEEPKDFLAQMVYKGKLLYFLDAMFPEAEDSIKIGYTGAQLKFCTENEAKIWAFFIDKKLLFSSSQNEYMKYLNDGPNTNGLPAESPAMIGWWTGWQIVKKFMKENKDYTLNRLMLENDAQKILNLSKYKPTK